MNNCNNMSNRNRFKYLALFYQKRFMPFHLTKNALDDPQNTEMFCDIFREFRISNQIRSHLVSIIHR